MAEAAKNLNPVPLTMVPPSRDEREMVRRAVREYVDETQLEAPFTTNNLLERAGIIARRWGFSPSYSKFVAILISNAVWKDRVSEVPYNKRILFLPQCVRPADECPAEVDAFGVKCQSCGRCSIGRLQQIALDLGYVVLVAEGTSVVTQMLLSGKIEAVIGVSCIAVLEKAFPYMAAGAIPGLAFPLLRDGCEDTELDEGWVLDAINLRSQKAIAARDISIDDLRDTVAHWFEPEPLDQLLDRTHTETEEIGIQWLSRGGKRWRPLLAASAFKALTGIDPTTDQRIQKIAIAVECFHKASLIHDDIEDDDDSRYDQPTLHVQHGMPVALNVGDYLLGEGYRLIAECGAKADATARMLRVAARGHRDLSLGQGDELWWTHEPGPLTVEQVIETFRRKTAPAFEVALTLGALCGGADNRMCDVLNRFSEKLGIAYQIQDDLDDYKHSELKSDIDAMRPSLLVALCYQAADDDLISRMEKAWQEHRSLNGLSHEVQQSIVTLDIPRAAEDMLEDYRDQALAELDSLNEAGLRLLLGRLTGKIVHAR